MKYYSYIMMVWLLALLAGCSDNSPVTDAGDAPTDGKHEVTLRFNLPQSQSRSYLSGNEVDYRHVREVYVYIFQQNGTNDDFHYIGYETVDWKGNVTQEHKLKTLLSDGTYTLMAVGMDDKAGKTYGFPTSNIQTSPDLSQIKALLQNEAKWRDMQQSDFYVATKEVTFEMVKNTTVELVMERRVSGVIVYVKNIPVQVNGSTVETVRLVLAGPQHKSVLLHDTESPYMNELAPTGSEVLMEYSLKDVPNDGTIYLPPMPQIPTDQVDESGAPIMETIQTVEGSLYMGAFLLPWQKIDGQPTMQLQLMGTTGDGSFGALKTYTIKYAGQGEQTPTAVFDIQQNHLYSIGKKVNREFTDGDEPFDLMGSSLEILVSDATDWNVDVEFPQVAQPPMASVDFDTVRYVHDCINTFINVRINSAYPEEKAWRLEVVYPEKETKPWCYIRIPDAGTVNPEDTLHQEYIGDGETMTIRVKLDDYVVNNDYSKPGISTAQQIMDDKRLCLLKLTDSDGHVQYLPIKQYNAIIVPMRDNEYNKASFGMSRRDFGAKVAKDGTFVEGEKHPVFQWGLTNTIYQFIYDEPWVSIPNNSIKENKYNGVKLFQRAHHGYNYGTGGASSLGSDTWTKGCLLFETSGANSFNRGRISKKSILPCWFVPAVEQGKAISDFVLRKNFTNEEIDAILNLKRDTQYWSLSIEGATIGVGTHVTYAFYPTKSNPKDDDDIKTQVFVRDNKFPVRLIRHLDDEMSEQLEHAPENYTGN